MRTTMFLLGVATLGAGCGFPTTASTAPALAPSLASSPHLVAGHERFVARCNGCHGYPAIDSVTAADWPAIMHKMGPKADLSAQETDDVLQFILAARGGSPGALVTGSR